MNAELRRSKILEVGILFNWHEEFRWWWSRRKAREAMRGMRQQGLPRKPLTPYRRWLEGEGAATKSLAPIRVILEDAGGAVSDVVDRIEITNLAFAGRKVDSPPGEPLKEGLTQLLLGRPTTWYIQRVDAPKRGYLHLYLAQDAGECEPGKTARDICNIRIGPKTAPLKFQLQIPRYDTLSERGETTLWIDVKVDPKKGAIVREHKHY